MFRFCFLTAATTLALGICGCYPSMYGPYQGRGMYGAPAMYGQPGTLVVPQQPGATGYPLNGTSTFGSGTTPPQDDFKNERDERFFNESGAGNDGGVPPAKDPGADTEKGGMFPSDNP
jgi:hypothetical protein